MASQSPVYNLSAVLRATGMKADVLRAWERRYHLPKPQRTPGGHRLYSEWDIETLKWLRSRQAEGLSISRAADLWKEMVEAGLDPLTKYPPAGAPLPPAHAPPAEARMEVLRQEWLSASAAYDGTRADEILSQAFAVFSVETVVTELLQRAISDMGHQWYLGRVTEQQEHFASGMASRRLEALIAAAAHPTRPQTVCVGCPPGERHTLPIEILGLLLQRRGLSVLYLGADVPVERLGETAQAARPDLIILAAQHLATAATLQSAALALQAGGIPLAYGGLVFTRIPGLRERIPAYYLGDSLGDSVGAIEQLLVAPAPYPTPAVMDRAHRALAKQYREKRASIEMTVIKKLQQADLQIGPIRAANSFFGHGLSAALDLGDPAFLEPDLEWVKGLLTGRRIQAGELETFLAAYSRTAHKELGEASRPVTEWIDSYLTRSRAARR